MFDFDVITGPTSSRPLAPGVKPPQGRSGDATDKASAGEHAGAPPANAEAMAMPPAPSSS
jgi:hypothetical protein